MRWHIALLVMLLLATPMVRVEAAGPDGAAAFQPAVERVIYGDELFGYNDWIEIHDTDSDGLGELITQGSFGLSAFDPPSFAGRKLSNRSFQAYSRPIYEDLGGNGSVQIILVEYLEERPNGFAGATVNIYDGKDFRQLWRSQAFDVPRVLEDGITIKDIDNDREKEIIFDSIEDLSAGATHRLKIFGGVSHELVWTSPSFSGPILIFYDNIDADPALELMVETLDREYSGSYTGLSLAVFDGATHEMQWEIPKRQDFYFDLRPWLPAPYFSYQRDIRDLNGDGFKEPVVLFEDIAGKVSGLRVHSGANGTLLWNDSVAGTAPRYYLDNSRDIADLDGDGRLELLATAQATDGNGMNSTDIRLLDAVSGALEWNTAIAGSVYKNEIIQLDTDPGAELLLIETGPPRPGNWSCEVYDLKEHNRSWGMDLESGPDLCSIYANDIDRDGISDLIFANTTMARINYTYYGTNQRVFTFCNTTFQVLDGMTFAPRWTSPISTNGSMRERLLVMDFDNGLPPVILINTYGMEGGERVNNTVRAYSTTFFRELLNLTVRDGTVWFRAMDYLGDPGKELVISVTGRFNGPKESLYLVDTRDFQLLWNNPGRKLGPRDTEGVRIMSADISGDPGRELVLCNYIVEQLEYSSNSYSELIAYGGTGRNQIWTSGILHGDYRLCGLGDLDGDSICEALLQSGADGNPLIFIEFPRDGTTGLPAGRLQDGLFIPRPSLNISSPKDGQKVFGLVNISGNASDALGIDSISVELNTPSPLHRRNVELDISYSNDRRFATWYGVWNSSTGEYSEYNITVSVKNWYSQYAKQSINITIKEELPPSRTEPVPIVFNTWFLFATTTIIVLVVAIMIVIRRRN